MAVYKASYCFPLSNSLDIRVAVNSLDKTPCEWFTCKVDSSNKQITGYKIRILDSANNQIFPSASSNDGKGYISPISELPQDPSDRFVNSGQNGSVLKIPFFQNYNYDAAALSNQMKLPSFNAVYYVPRYKVDYFLYETIDDTVTAEDHDTLIFEGRTAIWRGGEKLAIGDLLIFPIDITNSEKGIFKVTDISTYQDSVLRYTVRLERYLGIGDAQLRQHEVVLTKGNQHNTVIYFDSEGEMVDGHTGEWVDIEGNHLDFNIEGGSYKWEITLYQGEAMAEGKIITLGVSNVTVNYLDYSDIDYNWYDTVLNSGKVLGSTNKRIHVASDLGDEAILPVGDKESPLVLQGTYVQLLDSNQNPLSSRAYVQNYDSSYGHVYPIADSFTAEDIAAATKVCFYKHSNNAEEVLARERVYCATTPTSGPEGDGDLPIYLSVPVEFESVGTFENLGQYMSAWTENGGLYRKDGNEYIFCTEGDFSPSVTYYKATAWDWQGNTALGLPVIDGFQTKEDRPILVKNQKRQCENGVYYPHAGAAWTRSGSYKNWGDFIGAIIFVENGDTNGGTNWESTAAAGGSLFHADVSSGESPLLFVPEQPITLFPERISKTVDLVRKKMPHEELIPENGDEELINTGTTYRLLIYDYIYLSHYNDLNRILSDGVLFRPQQKILCYNDSHQIIEITDYQVVNDSPSLHSIILQYNIIDSATIGEYISVTNGQVYGNKVVRVASSSLIPQESFKIAYVLKNSTTHTYISPYIGLREDMALKLLNNKTVTYADDSVSQWIRITSNASDRKAVNPVTWRIEHEELTAPLASDSAVDSAVPFSYEVRTYYRASDENPFSSYENPYLKINKKADTYIDYFTTPTRYITLQASYNQFQQASWESYRWVLYSNNGNEEDKKIQDTGIKYDHDMEVTFYGLNNEISHNKYKAILYVTDDAGNELTAGYEFQVAAAESSSTISFNAEPDCTTHSILLSYTDSSGEEEGGYSIYRREYQAYRQKVGSLLPLITIVQKEWEPVALRTTLSSLRDFNIKSGHSYQYVIYAADKEKIKGVFANGPGEVIPYVENSVPLVPIWDEWSIAELKPVDVPVDAPIVRKAFEVDLDNIWLFKYGLETGSQNQNFQKNEIQTLGRYSKIGYGKANSISGDVSCYLGSEIIPYTSEGYIERMRGSIASPLSSNDKAYMLQKWREFAFSPNPKLLKDIKGQSWIVQIMSSSNSPKNFYVNQPDTISFSWKQIDDTDGVIIIGSGKTLPKTGKCAEVWEKFF